MADKKLVWFILFFLFSTTVGWSQKISPAVSISAGAVNGVFVEKNGKTLVVYGDPNSKLNKADMVLFTHFRRDVIWAGRKLAKGSNAVAPASEKAYFTGGDSIWRQFNKTRFHDYNNQTTKIGFSPVNVNRFVRGGETVKWQDIVFKVLDTPGYTRGSVSYIADIDSKRYAFVGDLIYGDGKILDLYSFQDPLKSIGGYHGYAARLGHLISSLKLIAAQKPDLIIPSRGPIIKDPASSIQKLIDRIQLLYSNYLSISALRWHHPDAVKILSDHILGKSAQVDYMPISSVIEKTPPSWFSHLVISNLLYAKDSSAFLIDCGYKGTYENILKLKNLGRLKRLDGIFITHYHDDHTNFINDLVKEFKCPVYITQEIKDILENPSAYRMPCLTTEPIRNLTVMQEGQKMKWKDFTLTFHFFPGQTLYHSALLVENDSKESIFFIGDSFTPAGIDDYCLLNRNFLHKGTGYLYCLDFLKKLPENVLLANQHVEPLFAFSRQQLDHMTKTLLKRNELLKDLFPWDNINYGIDEQWVSVYPYSQKAIPAQTLDFTVIVFNHSNKPNTFNLEPDVPDGFSAEPKTAEIVIAPLTEGEKTFKVKISKEASPGISLLTVNVKFGKWDLREWSEGIIEISISK